MREKTTGQVRRFQMPGLGCLLICACFVPGFAGVHNRGAPILQSYLPEDYNGHVQTFSITQGDGGMMYIANGAGVLEFDGVHWRTITHPGGVFPLSIAKDDKGTIFVGWESDIGFLEPDSIGRMKFRSLLSEIPEGDREFIDVWYTKPTADGIYFQSDTTLYRWAYQDNPRQGEMTTWTLPDSAFFSASLCFDDKLYVQDYRRRLYTVRNDSLIRVPLEIPEDCLIRQIHRVGEDTLIGAWGAPYVAYWRGDRLEPVEGEVVDFAREHIGRDVIRISDDLFALITEENGVAIFKLDGAIRQVLNQEEGLQDETVMGEPFVDDQGGLWLPLDYGLARVTLANDISRFSFSQGLLGGVHKVCGFRGRIYVATMQGLYELQPSRQPGMPASFREVEGIAATCWDIMPFKDRLLIATTEGVKEMLPSGRVRAIPQVPYNTQRIGLLADDETVAIASYYKGLHFIRLQDNQWTYVAGDLDGVSQFIGPLAIDEEGNLWINADWKHLEKVELGDPPRFDAFEVTIYDSARGVLHGELEPFVFKGTVYLGGGDGLLVYQEEDDTFVPSGLLGERFAYKGEPVSFPHVDPEGHLWFSSNGFFNPRVSFTAEGEPQFDLPLVAAQLPDIRTLYFDLHNDLLWAGGGGNTLIRLREEAKERSPLQSPPLLHGVYAEQDSLLYGGANGYKRRTPVLNYEHNSIRFEYAIPCYNTVARNRYQYRLVGLESAWSDWSEETDREYAALREGKYRFEVRGKNGYGKVSDVTSFTFRVLPPWGRSLWAYVAYLMLLTLLIFGVIKWRIGRLERERLHLQKLVEERTAQILKEKEKLAQAELEAEQVKRTNQIAATIAHEFNNPLAIIQGSADLMMDDVVDEETKRSLLQKIPLQVSRMHDLVDTLLNLKHVEEVPYAKGMNIIDLQASINKSREMKEKTDDRSSSESQD